MLAYKLFGAGSNTLVTASICDGATSLTAAGTNQATALALTNGVNGISTVSAGTGVILSDQARSGDSQVVYNGGANPLKVYPPSGAAINGLATNAAATLATKTACEYHCLSTTLWTGVLSAWERHYAGNAASLAAWTSGATAVPPAGILNHIVI